MFRDEVGWFAQGDASAIIDMRLIFYNYPIRIRESRI